MRETTERQESNTYSHVKEKARRDHNKEGFNNPYPIGSVEWGEYHSEETFIWSQEQQVY